jgi:hypothetical protein
MKPTNLLLAALVAARTVRHRRREREPRERIVAPGSPQPGSEWR